MLTPVELQRLSWYRVARLHYIQCMPLVIQCTSVSCVWSAQSGVVRCHCGCLQLLEYEAGSGRRAAAEDDEIPRQ